jgi:hypothetical protein
MVNIGEIIELMTVPREFKRKTVYVLGEDFTKEEYDKWFAQVALWISETQTNTENPKEKAREVMKAAISGRKLNGEIWVGIDSYDLASRIRQLCGWDIIKEVGRRSTRRTRKGQEPKHNAARRTNARVFAEVSLAEMTAGREAQKELLYQEFPFLDNPVYETTVNALADSTVKLEKISEDFLVADGKELKALIDVRDSLKKDIDDFMKLLKIHPSQLKDKVDEGDRGDVGTLVRKWEEYGEISTLYEQVDAIQEAIQVIRQLENIRVDGSPQLSDWLLWHKTGCRGHQFRCECGREYDIHGGFTKEEMYAIAEQAYKTFGFGIKKIDDTTQDTEDIGESETS